MADNSSDKFTFPSSPDNAMLIGCLFVRLGGSLFIGHDARRTRILPCYVDDIPQMPDPAPHEAFHSNAEYHGALKLVDYLLTRLAPEDLDFVYDALATVVTRQEAGL